MADYAQRRTTMVDTQVRPSDVTSFPILDALLTVPREIYVPASDREIAYAGAPIDIAPGRVLPEARTFAKMLEALDPGPRDLVLHVGAGLGYGTAVLARLAQAVVALEEDADLAAEAEATLTAQGVDTAALVQGPLAEGNARNAPYDAIFVEGGVERVPDALTDQLRDGGRIVAIFMDGALGEARLGVKAGGGVSWRMDFNATAPVLPGFAAERSFVF